MCLHATHGEEVKPRLHRHSMQTPLGGHTLRGIVHFLILARHLMMTRDVPPAFEALRACSSAITFKRQPHVGHAVNIDYILCLCLVGMDMFGIVSEGSTFLEESRKVPHATDDRHALPLLLVSVSCCNQDAWQFNDVSFIML